GANLLRCRVRLVESARVILSRRRSAGPESDVERWSRRLERAGDRGADPVLDKPGRLVAAAEDPLKPGGRESVLGVEDEADGEEPLGGRRGGVVEDGARRHAELIRTLATVMFAARLEVTGPARFAARTDGTVGPTQFLEVRTRAPLSAERGDKFLEPRIRAEDMQAAHRATSSDG